MNKTIIIASVLLVGCSTSNVKPEFKPLPPEKFDNLLYEDVLKNIAYKSVTKKDYECEEDC